MSQLALPDKGRAVKRLVISQTLHLTRPHTQKKNHLTFMVSIVITI